jgi:hypothetical protein
MITHNQRVAVHDYHNYRKGNSNVLGQSSMQRLYLLIYSTMTETKKIVSTTVSSSTDMNTHCCISSGEISGAAIPIRIPCNPERDGLLDTEGSMELLFWTSWIVALQ